MYNLQIRTFNTFLTLEEMEKSGIVNKKRMDTRTFWSLSERGTDLFKEMKRSYLFLANNTPTKD